MTIRMHNGLSTLFSRYLLVLGSVVVNSDDGIPIVKSMNVSKFMALLFSHFDCFSLLFLFRADKLSIASRVFRTCLSNRQGNQY